MKNKFGANLGILIQIAMIYRAFNHFVSSPLITGTPLNSFFLFNSIPNHCAMSSFYSLDATFVRLSIDGTVQLPSYRDAMAAALNPPDLFFSSFI